MASLAIPEKLQRLAIVLFLVQAFLANTIYYYINSTIAFATKIAFAPATFPAQPLSPVVP